MGFLPEKAGARRTRLEKLASDAGKSASTLVFYEAPHRILETLADLEAVWGPSLRVVVARELTKIHEEFVRGPVSQVIERFRATPPRGEVTLLIGAAPPLESTPDLTLRVNELLAEGRSASEVATTVAAEAGVSRRLVYRLLLGLKNYAKI